MPKLVFTGRCSSVNVHEGHSRLGFGLSEQFLPSESAHDGNTRDKYMYSKRVLVQKLNKNTVFWDRGSRVSTFGMSNRQLLGRSRSAGRMHSTIGGQGLSLFSWKTLENKELYLRREAFQRKGWRLLLVVSYYGFKYVFVRRVTCALLELESPACQVLVTQTYSYHSAQSFGFGSQPLVSRSPFPVLTTCCLLIFEAKVLWLQDWARPKLEMGIFLLIHTGVYMYIFIVPRLVFHNR